MSLFPQLGPGILTQLPYVADQEFFTGKVESPSGYRKTYAWRDSPLGKWSLSFANITVDELTVLETFIDAMDGPLKTFIYLDPAGNQAQSSNLTHASWTKNASSAGAIGQADPFGGTGAQILTSSGDGYVITQCFIDDIIGWSISSAVWLKMSTSTARDILVGLYTQTQSYTKTVHVTNGAWIRVDVSALVTDHVTNINPCFFQIGGASSIPTGSQVLVYAPQVSSMGACVDVVKSPENYGRHPYCRFEEDLRQVTYPMSPASRQIQLTIQEIHR